MYTCVFKGKFRKKKKMSRLILCTFSPIFQCTHISNIFMENAQNHKSNFGFFNVKTFFHKNKYMSYITYPHNPHTRLAYYTKTHYNLSRTTILCRNTSYNMGLKSFSGTYTHMHCENVTPGEKKSTQTHTPI